MTSHAYARKLLELPDVEILAMRSDESYSPADDPELVQMHFGLNGPYKGDYLDHYVNPTTNKCLRCERPDLYSLVTVVQLV